MSKKIKVLLFASLVLNVLFIGVGGLAFFKLNGFTILSNMINPSQPHYSENKFYQEKTSLFNYVDIPEESIVFLGDSITERAAWYEIFPEYEVINRGIGSDTTEGVLARLDSIIDSKPKKIFLMVGINDLRYKNSVSDIQANYSEILSKIKSSSPKTEVYVQSVLPVNNELFGDGVSNHQVEELNKQLEKLSGDYNYTFIDLYSMLSNHGQLPGNLTTDGIHLLGDAYQMWKQEIEPHINS